MSLILEALRKLERDKPAPERGVVVMTSAGLGESRSERGPWLWITLGLIAGLGGAAAFLEWRRPPKASTDHVPAPVSAPATTSRPAPVTVAASLPASVPVPSFSMPTPATRPVPKPTPHVPLPAVMPESAPEPAAEATQPPAPDTTLSPSPAPVLVLQAITVQDGHPVALINDRVLREGDEIHGVRIRRIGEAEVEIERDGQREVLSF